MLFTSSACSNTNTVCCETWQPYVSHNAYFKIMSAISTYVTLYMGAFRDLERVLYPELCLKTI